MAAIAPVVNPIWQALHTCGFQDPVINQRIRDDAFQTWEDFKILTEKDISELSDQYAKRTQNEGRVHFGLQRTKRLKGLMHWAQDCYRCGETPDINDFNLDEANSALMRAKARKDMKDSKEKVDKPSPLKGGNEFVKFISQLENYLESIIGVNGVPLKYIIRQEVQPGLQEQFDSYHQKVIATAPLQGVYFSEDARTVHRLIAELTHGLPSEEYIKQLKRKANGRMDVLALKAHYLGVGNTTRRVAEADALVLSLHYRSEKSQPFEKFLDKFQLMCTIFFENGEEKSDQEKRRMIFEMCKDASDEAFQISLGHLKYKSRRDEVNFSDVINDLTTTISESKKARSRFISDTTSSKSGRGSQESNHGRGFSGRGGRGRGGRGGRSGNVEEEKPNTDYYTKEEWYKLSFEERDRILALREEERKGSEDEAPSKRVIESLKSQIEALETKMEERDEEKKDDGTHSGSAFGGKAEAERKKRRTD